MTFAKYYQPMTEEELKETAKNISTLELEEQHLQYVTRLYEASLEELAWQENKVRDMKAQLDSVLVEEV
jgi:hypothetical protein